MAPLRERESCARSGRLPIASKAIGVSGCTLITRSRFQSAKGKGEHTLTHRHEKGKAGLGEWG